MMAYNAVGMNVPSKVREALQDAMEIAVDNVPEIPGQIYICVDTSGSMGSAVTGDRGSVTSKVSCREVAALFASAMLRKNKSAQVIPFDTSVHIVDVNPRDTVITNARKLALSGGGTDCSCAMRYLNDKKATGSAVVFLSDYESWVDRGYTGTGLLNEWNRFQDRNPKAKLVCIDLTPRTNSQVNNHKNILQVGGFGDSVFDVAANFVKFGDSEDHWLQEIEAISLEREVVVADAEEETETA